MIQIMTDQTYYKDGYDSTVSNSHSWRTAENSCSYFLNYIKPTDKVLDVGCGPGSITYDLASKYLPQGEIIGIEPTQELIDEALNNNTARISNAKFQKASIYSLPFPDETFDIVHAHQVVVHLEEPLKAFKEMKRVLKKSGYLCCRDSEANSLIVYPQSFKSPLGFYFEKLATEFTSPIGASRIKELALATKFEPNSIINTTSTWCISSRNDRTWFSELMLKRLGNVKFKANDKYSKDQLREAWIQWRNDDKSLYTILHGEIIAQK